MTDHSILGKTVLIAGGAKNLGGLVATDLAKQGAAAVAIHYNSDAAKPEADETLAAIVATGARGYAFQADLTTAGAMEKLFTKAVAAMGSIDIAINTVGKVLKKPMINITEAEFDSMNAVNSKSAFSFLEKPAGTSATMAGSVRWSRPCSAPSRRTMLPTLAPKRLSNTIPGRQLRNLENAVYPSLQSVPAPWTHRSSTRLKKTTR